VGLVKILKDYIFPIILVLLGAYLSSREDVLTHILDIVFLDLPVYVILIILFVAYILRYFYQNRQYSDVINRRDSDIFKRMSNDFNHNDILTMLKDHDFANPFRDDIFDPLFKYEYFLNDPENIITRNNLNKLQLSLVDTINKFVRKISNYTFPLQQNIQGIPRDRREIDESKIKELNELATILYKQYHSFYSKGIKILLKDLQ
jgi:hypothetical protein